MAEPVFEKLWQRLQTHCRPGTSIPNWTAHKGYLGDVMTVVAIDQGHIVFAAPNAKNLQQVPKEDFGEVWKIWPGYKSGLVERQTIRNMTRYSKFILSTLRWVEEKQFESF